MILVRHVVLCLENLEMAKTAAGSKARVSRIDSSMQS